MNFIAHFHLSAYRNNFIVGNYLADLITNHEFKNLSPEPLEGVLFHRFIDDYTDHHPVLTEMKKMFYERHGKYSPVLVDVFMDFSLFENWQVYESRDFGRFCKKVYSILESNQKWIPHRLTPVFQGMLRDNWLYEYTTYEGLERTFQRIATIARFSGNFAEAVHTYVSNKTAFDTLFNLFYPDIIKACEVYQPSK